MVRTLLGSLCYVIGRYIQYRPLLCPRYPFLDRSCTTLYECTVRALPEVSVWYPEYPALDRSNYRLGVHTEHVKIRQIVYSTYYVRHFKLQGISVIHTFPYLMTD